jgi:hypothetical protein
VVRTEDIHKFILPTMGRRTGASFNPYNSLARKSSGQHQHFRSSKVRRTRSNLSRRAQDASLDTLSVSITKVCFFSLSLSLSLPFCFNA